MGFSDINVFKKKYKEIETMIKAGSLREYRYDSVFEAAPIICEFVKTEELGTRN